MEIKQKTNRFSIVGKAKFNKYTFNMNVQSKNNSDYVYHRLNLGVDCGQGNVIYSSLMGGKNNVVYVHGKKERIDPNTKKVAKSKDGKTLYTDDWENQYTIDWDKRLDINEINKVGNQCFLRARIEKDEDGELITKRFLTEWDFIEYLEETLEEDTPIYVKGKLNRNVHNGNVRVDKVITSVSLANEDIEEEDYKGSFAQTYYATKDSLIDFNDEGTYYMVNVHPAQYIGKPYKETILVDEQIALSVEKFGDKTEKIAKKFFAPKRDGVNEITVTGTFQEGAETTVSDIKDLPEDVQELVEYGILTKEQAIAQCTTGERDKKMLFQSIEIRKVKVEGSDEKEVQLQFVPNICDVDDLKFYGDLKVKKQKPKEEDTLSDALDDLGDDLDIDELMNFMEDE